MNNVQLYKLIEQRISETDYAKSNNLNAKLAVAFAYKGVKAVLAVAFYNEDGTLASSKNVVVIDTSDNYVYSIFLVKKHLSSNEWLRSMTEQFKLNNSCKTIPIEKLKIPESIEYSLLRDLISACQDSNLGLVMVPGAIPIIKPDESYEELSIKADLMFCDDIA